MFCYIYRWIVSRTLEAGKEMPGMVNRHMARCRDCRDFAGGTRLLAEGLRRDAPGFLQKDPDHHESLNIRIFAALEREMNAPAASPPAPSAPARRFRFMLTPALAAAMLVLAVSIAVMFQVIPKRAPGPGENPMASLTAPAALENPLRVLQHVESPIETEMRSLGQSLNSAAVFLASCLDVKINGQEKGAF